MNLGATKGTQSLVPHNFVLSWSDWDSQHQNRSIQRCCNGVLFFSSVTSYASKFAVFALPRGRVREILPSVL